MRASHELSRVLFHGGEMAGGGRADGDYTLLFRIAA